jgi:hypothetical protein
MMGICIDSNAAHTLNVSYCSDKLAHTMEKPTDGDVITAYDGDACTQEAPCTLDHYEKFTHEGDVRQLALKVITDAAPYDKRQCSAPIAGETMNLVFVNRTGVQLEVKYEPTVNLVTGQCDEDNLQHRSILAGKTL